MEEKKELLNQDERVVEIELERLRGFVNHPFKVRADSQMIELQESIKKYGILNPLIVRPRQDGTYEPASAPLLASLYTILKSHALFLALLPQSATKIFPSPVIPLSTI